LIYLSYLSSSSLCLSSSSSFILVRELDCLVHLVLFSSSSSSSCSCLVHVPSSSYSSPCMSQILDMTWYNLIFLIIMFIAYFDYMFSIDGLALCLYPCSYSVYPLISAVGGRSCVSVVLRQCLYANAPLFRVMW